MPRTGRGFSTPGPKMLAHQRPVEPPATSESFHLSFFANFQFWLRYSRERTYSISLILIRPWSFNFSRALPPEVCKGIAEGCAKIGLSNPVLHIKDSQTVHLRGSEREMINGTSLLFEDSSIVQDRADDIRAALARSAIVLFGPGGLPQVKQLLP